MKLLREKPYKVQKSGQRGAKLRLSPILKAIGEVSTGDKLHLFTDANDRLILSLSPRMPKALSRASDRTEVIRESGSFFGIFVPVSAQKLTGLRPGARYLMYLDNHRIVVEQVE